MKNFIKGMLSLWTVLTTIWTAITFMLIGAMLEGLADLKKERESRERHTYRGFYDKNR